MIVLLFKLSLVSIYDLLSCYASLFAFVLFVFNLLVLMCVFLFLPDVNRGIIGGLKKRNPSDYGRESESIST